jgi:hypothetical protein
MGRTLKKPELASERPVVLTAPAAAKAFEASGKLVSRNDDDRYTVLNINASLT